VSSDLVIADYKKVKPETVNSYEVGYKGILGGKLLVDVYGYYSIYRDFLATIGVGQSNLPGNSQGLLSALTTTNVSYVQNADEDVKALGWGLSAEYQAGKGYFVYGNVFSDKLQDLPPDFVSFFNAPKYRFNLGVRNENIYKGVGFNIIAKYQGDNRKK
jgi:outer membrane receptor protein involved in Fe transport